MQSKLFLDHGIEHGFGNRDIPFPLSDIWKSKMPKWKQVHGNAIGEVKMLGENVGEVDAVFTKQRLLPVGVVSADCVPVLLSRKDGGAVAAAHAGWRGTEVRVVHELILRLKASGENLGDWVGAVGPSIGPCCYEVSEELTEKFKTRFTKLGFGYAVPKFRILDLPAINEWELKSAGISGVEVLRICTQCSGGKDPLFHSYRREKGTGRQWSVVVGKVVT
jgi:YfiH family protein